MYPYHTKQTTPSLLIKEKILLCSQGGLFTVKQLTLLKHQTNASCADDDRRMQESKRLARVACFALCEDAKTASTALPFTLAQDKHFMREVEYAIMHKKVRQGRAVIVEFSKRSRSRLLKVGARLDQNCSGLMMTFTYRENMRDHVMAKKQLILVSKWLKYHYKKIALLWRLEYQKRGAIHFHVLAFNVAFVDAQKLTEYWQEMTGDKSYPDIKRIRSRRRVMSYISKYIAKVSQSEGTAIADGGFINVPYLENFTGRFWGIINRVSMPWALEHKMFVAGDSKLLDNLLRYARRKWNGMSRRRQGFHLFVGDADQWMRLAEWELMRSYV